jgi:FkbH-like protein
MSWFARRRPGPRVLDDESVETPPPNLGFLDSTVADGDIVEDLFEAILGRRLNNEKVKAEVAGIGSVKYWVDRLVNSEEFYNRFIQQRGIVARSPEYIADEEFRTPRLTAEPLSAKIVVVGSCMAQDWKEIIERAYSGIDVAYKIFNNASELEEIADSEIEATAFQITQIPLRSLIVEGEYFSLNVDDAGKRELERVFERAVERLRNNLVAALKYNRRSGLMTFVLSLPTPQANPLGRLAPRYELTDFRYFIGELNKKLYEEIQNERNVHLIDFDDIAASLGKRHILDDATMHLNHASFLRPANFEEELDLTPYGRFASLFAPQLETMTLAIFQECLAAHRILSPSAKIKLVIFDLDGTLWRGVAAESDDVGPELSEGWPLGVLEAAAFLRKRGVLLAIASKNDPDIATRIWERVYGAVFPLENFASIKFSWRPKSESIAEILRETNLLPENTLFVDDNPLERERAKLAFPSLRLLEGPISTWRRQLLWAEELQIPYITEEAINRSASIRSMKARETLRKQVDEATYLDSLAVKVEIARIDSSSSPAFRRAFELLNKTNQFNTTGRRWAQNEIEKFFDAGGCVLSARVSDRLSDYGLTALALSAGPRCEQMVMSCRVFGLGVEFRLLEALKAQADAPLIFAYRATTKNGPAKSFLEKIGLTPGADADAQDEQVLVLSPSS